MDKNATSTDFCPEFWILLLILMVFALSPYPQFIAEEKQETPETE